MFGGLHDIFLAIILVFYGFVKYLIYMGDKFTSELAELENV